MWLCTHGLPCKHPRLHPQGTLAAWLTLGFDVLGMLERKDPSAAQYIASAQDLVCALGHGKKSL